MRNKKDGQIRCWKPESYRFLNCTNFNITGSSIQAFPQLIYTLYYNSIKRAENFDCFSVLNLRENQTDRKDEEVFGENREKKVKNPLEFQKIDWQAMESWYILITCKVTPYDIAYHSFTKDWKRRQRKMISLSWSYGPAEEKGGYPICWELTSQKNAREKRSMASVREWRQRTDARFWRAAEQKAENICLINLWPHPAVAYSFTRKYWGNQWTLKLWHSKKTGILSDCMQKENPVRIRCLLPMREKIGWT